ncbi:MAG: hypothetical protein U0X91_12415 [Spirosomataceae bacterium]
MNILIFKLTIIPAVIGLITLASRKWGNKAGGVLGSMPWVAGPILVFFIVEQGREFGIQSIPGILMGIVSLVVFCYTYALLSKYRKWPSTLLLSYIFFLATALLLDFLHFSLLPIYGLAIGSILIALRYFPVPIETEKARVAKRLKYDILFRMAVATLFVVVITGAAEVLGPAKSGILTPFPILTSILAVFTHYLQGSKATITILRGIMIGLTGFTTFLFLQAFLLKEFSIAVAFLIALAVNAAINLIAVRVW